MFLYLALLIFCQYKASGYCNYSEHLLSWIPLISNIKFFKLFFDTFSALNECPYKFLWYLELRYLELSLWRAIFVVPPAIFRVTFHPLPPANLIMKYWKYELENRNWMFIFFFQHWNTSKENLKTSWLQNTYKSDLCKIEIGKIYRVTWKNFFAIRIFTISNFYISPVKIQKSTFSLYNLVTIFVTKFSYKNVNNHYVLIRT